MTSIAKSRRKQFVRTPPERDPDLLPRDVSILDAIEACGGMLSTVQVQMWFWGPSLPRRLRWWGVDKQTGAQIMERYSARAIDQITQLGRWLLSIRTADPELLASLDPALSALRPETRTQWLLQALERGVSLPEAFLSRPTKPSQFVSRACTQRLRLLYDASWLEKDEPSTKLHLGRGQTLWYLTQKSRVYLARLRKVPVKQVRFKQPGRGSDLHLPHRLAVTDFKISLSLSANRLGYEIPKWVDEVELKRSSRKYKISLPADPDEPDGDQTTTTLEPDGYFWLETGNSWFHFLEIDRGTETLQYASPDRALTEWAWTVRKYGAFFKTWYEQVYPEAQGRGRILVVTTGKTRLANMAGVCCQVAGKAAGRYWFTCFSRLAPTYDDYFSNAILSEPIWQRADRLEEKRTLVW